MEFAWWGWLWVFVLVVALYARSMEVEQEEFDAFMAQKASKRFYREMDALAQQRRKGGKI